MGYSYYFAWLFMSISLVNCRTILVNILPNGKAKELVPSSYNIDGVVETEWRVETSENYKVRLSCKMNILDCFVATLTIDNGGEEATYCSHDSDSHVLRISQKNEMTVNLMTRNAAQKSVVCEVSAIKSFIDFKETHIDSSEAGFKSGKISTTCPCGWSNKNPGRIVGGKKAMVNEFSFPVVIVRKDKKLAFCGGSVITAYHILTAAHCTYTLNKNVPLIVGVGEHDLSTVKETNATQLIPVEKIINHEEFNGVSKLYDISILVLKNEIIFNEIVGPVCLPNKKINLEEKFVKVMGWGKLAERGVQTKVLMKADLKVVDFEQCREFYRKIRLEDPHQFCTYGHRKDTCAGDSGGPVVWLDPETNRYTQVGLVSYGKGCASEDVPGVNTDVYYFMDWIQKKIQETKPSPVCMKET